MEDVLVIEAAEKFDPDDENNYLEKLKIKATKRRGRGFQVNEPSELLKSCEGLEPESDDHKPGTPQKYKPGTPQRSVEGWIVFVTGVHEEAHEDDLSDKFGDYGEIKNIHLNLDRRTGFIKGYALIEFETFGEAKAAIAGLNRTCLLGHPISVDWCFINGPKRYRNKKDCKDRRSCSYSGELKVKK